MNKLQREVALGYARGWTFTPLHGKKPWLTRWQTRQPWPLDLLMVHAKHGNMGLRTGSWSGITVVDLDHDAEIDWTYLPPTVTAQTGSGGFHLYYQSPPGNIGNRSRSLRDRDGSILRGVDLRGERGQVVFVGSVHPETGRMYQWIACPQEADVAPFPMWLIAEPERRPAPAGGHRCRSGRLDRYIATVCRTVAGAMNGSRNDTLNRAAYGIARRAAANGLDLQPIAEQLLAAALQAGLPEHEAIATIRSGMRSGRLNPMMEDAA